jgi:hypothetical protein
MVSTISFIQSNLQRSYAAASIFTRVVSIKGIDLALIQEPCYQDECVSGLNISGYTLYSARIDLKHPGQRHEHMGAARCLL